MRKDIKRGVVRFYLAQLLLILILAVVFYTGFDQRALISSVLGGFVCLMPSMLFAITFFRHKGAQNIKRIMGAFYLGEAVKLILTGALFALVFINYKVNASAFFITFIAVQALYWCAPWLIVKNK